MGIDGTSGAVLRALQEAIAFINSDKRGAARR
jgi:hypothetical protein